MVISVVNQPKQLKVKNKQKKEYLFSHVLQGEKTQVYKVLMKLEKKKKRKYWPWRAPWGTKFCIKEQMHMRGILLSFCP